MKPKLLLWLTIFTLATLACGVQKQIPNTQTATQMSTDVKPTATEATYYVKADTLNLRACGSTKCEADPKGLKRGEKVEVYLTCTGGVFAEWVAIDVDCTQWVKASWLEER